MESKPNIIEIEAQLSGGILLLHSESRVDEAIKFQQEVSDMGIFVAREGELTNENIIHLTDTAKLILLLPDKTLDHKTSKLLDHIISTRSGYAQVYLKEEDKRNKILTLADRELDWTKKNEQDRLLRTFGKKLANSNK